MVPTVITNIHTRKHKKFGNNSHWVDWSKCKHMKDTRKSFWNLWPIYKDLYKIYCINYNHICFCINWIKIRFNQNKKYWFCGRHICVRMWITGTRFERLIYYLDISFWFFITHTTKTKQIMWHTVYGMWQYKLRSKKGPFQREFMGKPLLFIYLTIRYQEISSEMFLSAVTNVQIRWRLNSMDDSAIYHESYC